MTLERPDIDATALNVVIETARLRLEPLSGRHAAPLFAGLREPAVYEWISLPLPEDPLWLAERWSRVEQRVLVSDGMIDLGWAVQRVADGAWIGKMDAEVMTHGVATNVGYMFFPAFWRQGYASEAVIAVCEHLARHGVIEQRATVTIGNDGSMRVLERAGFVRGRVLPANDTIRGVVYDDQEFVRFG